jgi:hypothetical protein
MSTKLYSPFLAVMTVKTGRRHAVGRGQHGNQTDEARALRRNEDHIEKGDIFTSRRGSWNGAPSRPRLRGPSHTLPDLATRIARDDHLPRNKVAWLLEEPRRLRPAQCVSGSQLMPKLLIFSG